MAHYQEKIFQNRTQTSPANSNANYSAVQLKDNRELHVVQQKLSERSAIQESSFTPIQRKNNTGLPDNLKSGIENLSGHSMDDVKVHYNPSATSSEATTFTSHKTTSWRKILLE